MGDTRETCIPKEFRGKYERLLGSESAEFFRCCGTKIPKSIWVNSLKANPEKLSGALASKGWTLGPLFHENAFALEGIERPGQSAEFRGGLFNLQEKSSMLPAIILNPQKNDFVLDACAAPGNKTLQLSCLMHGRGKIVAADKNVARFKSLAFNAKKFGMKNVICQRQDILTAKKREVFGKILLDAPCSSEGLVRKDVDALANWSPRLVEEKSALQKRLFEKCLQLLKRGGEMVYSTCSLSPEENEEVLGGFLARGKIEMLEAGIAGFKARPGLLVYNGKEFGKEMEKAMRILPQDNDSQAFFIAKIRKL